jgi:hypothetical protein
MTVISDFLHIRLDALSQLAAGTDRNRFSSAAKRGANISPQAGFGKKPDAAVKCGIFVGFDGEYAGAAV